MAATNMARAEIDEAAAPTWTERAVWVAAACWLGAATIYLATEAISAAAFSPAYSYAHNYISDLGVPVCGAVFDGRAICSPLHGLMNAGFIFQGPLFLGGALAISRIIRRPAKYPLIVFATMNGVGTCLIGVFPEQIAQQTTTTMGAHVLGAFLAIVAGNATTLTSVFAFRGLGLPRFHRHLSLALPTIAAASLAMLLWARHSGAAIVVPDGVWERLSVYTITAWESLSAVSVLSRLASHRRNVATRS